MTEIRGIDIEDTIAVTKADPTHRDMYGGAVRIEVRWEAGGCSGMSSVELDGRGVAELRHALADTLDESVADYNDLREARHV